MFRKKAKLLVYLLILLGAFFLLFVRSNFLSSLKLTIVKGVAFPVRILSLPLREAKKILFYHRIFNDYIKFKKEANTLKARLIGMDEVLRENSRLERLLDFKRKLIFSSVAANIGGRDPSNWNAALIIDKGKKDGIDVGMPVVDALGVVGKVVEVAEHKGKIILLNDPAFSVAAVVQRSREVGLVSGTLKGMCRMRYLSEGADVQVGDQIITSRLSSSFPEGLLIGKVVAVRRSEKNSKVDCLVQPAVSLSQLEEVLVIQK